MKKKISRQYEDTRPAIHLRTLKNNKYARTMDNFSRQPLGTVPVNLHNACANE